MTTTSPRLGLIVPARTDPFSTTDIAGNWSKIDTAYGQHADDIASLNSTATSLQGQINNKANTSHSHAEGDITNLSADINNLQAQINNRSAVGHTHNETDVSGLPGDITNLQNQINGLSWSNVGNKPLSQAKFGQAYIALDSGGHGQIQHGMNPPPPGAVVTHYTGNTEGGPILVVVKSIDATYINIRAWNTGVAGSGGTPYSAPYGSVNANFFWVALQ